MRLSLILCTLLASSWGDDFISTSNIAKAHAMYPQVFRQSVGMLERDALEYRVKIDELEIKKLKGQLRTLKTTVATLSSTLQDKERQNVAYEEKLKELQGEFLSLKNAYDTLPHDAVLLMSKVEELKKKNNELSLIGSLKNPSGYAIYDMEQEVQSIRKEYNQLQKDYRKLMMTTGALSRR